MFTLLGFGLSVLWGWFIVSAFGVVPLELAEACGVTLLLGYITSKCPPKKDREDSADLPEVGYVMVFIFTQTVLSLAVGWIVLQFLV